MTREATELPALMTVAELAREWRQDRRTIYRKIERGEIPAVRLGDGTSALRIRRGELEARLAQTDKEEK